MAEDAVARLARRPWRDVALPPDAVGIPTMLSKTERKLLYGLARDYASGDAAIVDAGCFLGGSTAALLAGMRDRAEPWNGPPLASYDLFRVEEYTLGKFFGDDPELRVGASFRGRFDANVARFDLPHEVHEGDIAGLGWAGGPIDVLFLDVLKSPELNDAVLRDFFPSLVPRRSVIVHQDYGWGWMPWIPVTVELMRDSLVLLDWMEWGSHVFLLTGEVPAELLEHGVGGVDVDRRLALLEGAIERSDGSVRGMLEIDRAALLLERDGEDAALAELAAVAQRYQRYGSVLAAIDDPEAGVTTATLRNGGRSWPQRLAGRLAARR
jgi:hypothetical protein